MKIDLTRFIDKFRHETRENLTSFDTALSNLEHNMHSNSESFQSACQELMRLAHAIKGAAKMLSFTKVNTLCHSIEELVIKVRQTGYCTDAVIDILFEGRKGIEKLISSVTPDATNEDGDDFLPLLLENIKYFAENDWESGKQEIKQLPKEPSISSHKTKEPNSDPAIESHWRDSTVRVNVNAIDDLLLFGRELALAMEGLRTVVNEVDKIRLQVENRIALDEVFDSRDNLKMSDIQIERELSKSVSSFKQKLTEVERHVREIDSGAVELRMRPIQELYELLPLQVRGLAKYLNKEIDVMFTGGEVRLDGRIIEMLNEPFIHIIRNCIDHGIEHPEDRDLCGKDRTGRLIVSTRENAGWVWITIADDGKGIDPEKIWERAYELGLTTKSNPDDDDLSKALQFLFSDHFTSKKGASDVSGRGIGMAAVKRRVKELRGDVTIESEIGLGTRIILNIPTSLSSQRILVTSIQHALTGNIVLGIPTAMVRNTSTVVKNEQRHLSLGKIIGKMVPQDLKESYVIELDDGVRSGTVTVNQIIAETEAVIEPLPNIARQIINIISGATAITAEQIMLILNVPALLAAPHQQFSN